MVIYVGMHVTLSIGADIFAASGARVVSVITTGSTALSKNGGALDFPWLFQTVDRRYITTAFFSDAVGQIGTV